MALLLRGKTIEQVRTEAEPVVEARDPEELPWAAREIVWLAYEMRVTVIKVAAMGGWLDHHHEHPKWGDRYVTYRVTQNRVHQVAERLNELIAWTEQRLASAADAEKDELRKEFPWMLGGRATIWAKVSEDMERDYPASIN